MKGLFPILFIQTCNLKIFLPHTCNVYGENPFCQFSPWEEWNLLEMSCLLWYPSFYAPFVERMLILSHSKLLLEEEPKFFNSCQNSELEEWVISFSHWSVHHLKVLKNGYSSSQNAKKHVWYWSIKARPLLTNKSSMKYMSLFIAQGISFVSSSLKGFFFNK